MIIQWLPGNRWITKRHKEASEGDGDIHSLDYDDGKSHQSIYKYLQFSVCQLSLNKAVRKKILDIPKSELNQLIN